MNSIEFSSMVESHIPPADKRTSETWGETADRIEEFNPELAQFLRDAEEVWFEKYT